MTGITIPNPMTLKLDIPLNVTGTVHGDVALVGDPAHPVAARVELLGDPTKPVAARVELLGDPTKPVAARVELLGDPTKPVAAQIQLIGDPQRPVTAKVGLSMLLENLPVLTKDDLFRLLRRRIRLPLNFRFGMSVFPLNLFGVDAIQFSLCGEPQLILDDYVPNAYERCEVECEPCQP